MEGDNQLTAIPSKLKSNATVERSHSWRRLRLTRKENIGRLVVGAKDISGNPL